MSFYRNTAPTGLFNSIELYSAEEIQNSKIVNVNNITKVKY